jgi:ankyrin repeat protein
MLIEHGAVVAAQNNDWETPLHLASRWGKVEVARMLIEHGADVAAQNKDLETPLHLASRPDSRSFQLKEPGKVSQLLFEQGTDVIAKNKDGLTPFHLASLSRHPEDSCAQVLLQHGADPGDVSLGVFGLDWDPEMDWDWDRHSG